MLKIKNLNKKGGYDVYKKPAKNLFYTGTLERMVKMYYILNM